MKRGIFISSLVVLSAISCTSTHEDKGRAELDAARAEVERLKKELNDLKEAGILVQTGNVELRLGEIDVFYPRSYVREPELTFPLREVVEFEIIEQSPTGFRIRVTNLSRAAEGPPNKLEWRAAGEISDASN